MSDDGEPTSDPTVLFYCQHSTGLGHLVRSLAVAGALAGRFRVVFCTGGRAPRGLPLPAGVDVVSLSPVGTDASGRLASLDPSASLAEAFERRRRQLLEVLAATSPVAVLVELFPFGRRKFASELVPLLEAARSAAERPVVISSVRDLLVTGHPDKQRHDDEAAARLDAYFDAVIVHGDPRFARLEETFRPRTRPSVPFIYSGFVTGRPRPARPSSPPRPSVLVSAGGGLVGGGLFAAAAESHQFLHRRVGATTRIVTGPYLAAEDFEELHALADRTAGLTVERFVADLAQVMAGSSVSVSQCGYNTSLDILASGTPSLVVPHAAPGEDEQTERARRLEALGVVDVLPATALSGLGLARRVLSLLDRAPRADSPLLMDGATATAQLVASLVDGALVATR